MGVFSFNDMTNQKGLIPFQIIIAITVILIFIAVANLLPIKDKFLSQVYPQEKSLALDESCKSLQILVSADKINWATTANLPSGTTRYYIKAKSRSNPNILCSVNFSVLLPNGSVVPNWGAYKSGLDGVARIDIGGIADGTYKASYKPRGSNGEWSNQITVVVNNSLLNNYPTINFSEYFITTPGYVWIYTSKNNIINQTGTTRLQTELPISICGGLEIIPWRFTKDSDYQYWNPYLPGITSWIENGKHDLRWMIVKPGYTYQKDGNYNNFIWAYSAKYYKRQNIRDINLFDSNYYTHQFISLSPRHIPAYNLGLKTFKGMYYSAEEGNTSAIFGKSLCPPNNEISRVGVTSESINGERGSSWRIRTEKDYIKISNSTFNYQGEALRVDYFEGGNPLDTVSSWRESWYFVKNIGLVKIVVKNYNKPGVLLNCSDDADCLNDSIAKPDIEVTLKNYYQNPQLSVSVSPDNRSFSSSIKTTVRQGYYLKINNSSYTGYLESQLISSPAGSSFPKKWLWSENGLVFVEPTTLTGIRTGAYTAKYRVWIPNEIINGETRLTTNQLPFSNTITVDILP